MSLKLKALLQLAGIVIAALSGGILFHLATLTFSAQTLLTALQFGLMGGLLYMCYGLILSRLESQEKIKELINKSIDK